jgi:23S rRNA G2069 N7-methylase RlmK/C1962 C5-methylase RlmI
MFASRLCKRMRHLQKGARREGTGVFRLYDRDIPEIPLVLDFYEGARDGESCRALFGALYKRPYEKDEAEEAAWLGAMKKAASQALLIPEERVFLKERRRISAYAQYRKNEAARPFELDVREGGLLFRVNLSGYIDSGLYHDARKVRALFAGGVEGKKVLNLFCYTGAFSVYAAAAKAARIDSVDLSAVSLERAAVNFALNGLEKSGAFRFIRSGALEFLDGAGAERWDRIVLDPPVFSNSKKTRRDLDLKRDYPDLLRRALRILAPGGELYFGARLRGFDPRAAAEPLSRAFPGLLTEDLSRHVRSEDFAKRRTPLWLRFTLPS